MSRTDAPIGPGGEARDQQLRLLVEHVSDYAIFMLGPDGTVASWNRGAERIKGYAAAEIIGRPYATFFPEPDVRRGRPDEALAIARRDGRFQEEGWRVRKDGTTFWAGVVVTAVRDDDGVLVGYAKVTRDLTAPRAAEQALRASRDELARANRELDRFTSVAAHDLHEPLRTVSGFAELLARRYAAELDERATGWLEHIVQGVARMEHLVDSLLEYARSGSLASAAGAVDIASVVEMKLADLRAAIASRDARVEVEVPDGAAVLASEQDLGSVLSNLMSNAVKFADGERPHVRIRAERHGDAWRVEVADNGIGIDPADRPRVFAAFHRLHSAAEYPGTGLGLAIAQRVVERRGGAIGVESVVGEGSRFWFLLPAA